MRAQAHWPAGLVERLEWVVDLRNFLAHYYLCELFVLQPTPELYEHAAEELVRWSNHVEQVDHELESHGETPGVPSISVLDPQVQAEIDSSRPSWELSN